jgi:serine/threonine protein kinase
MWGCGCILFVLLSGNLPFNGKNQKDLFRKIVAGKYEMVESDWEGVSEEAKDLVRGLLVTDPDKRMTAADAIRSKWIRESSKRLLMHDLALTTERLKSFNARLKFRSAFIAVGWINKMSNF